MKKILVELLVILLAILAPISIIAPAQAHINKWTWLSPYIFKGYDKTYEDYVVIYRDGSTVNLIVPVENDYGAPINVSKVIINFDWGANKTLDLLANPVQIPNGETEFLTVGFTADATEALSSDWTHTYAVYVEHVNATTGPKEIVDTWERPWDYSYPPYKFVVFPTSQADVFDLRMKYQDYYNQYRWQYFSSAQARMLAGQAAIEGSAGDTHYMRGDYASAGTQYQTAMDLYDQALSAESEWATTSQESQLNVTQTQAEAALTGANAALKQADAAMKEANATKTEADAATISANAAMTNAYGWMAIGVGSTLIGIGVIIYGIRKPKTP